MDLLASITGFSGIGDKTAQKLAKLGIFTLYDLLTHLPVKYQNRSQISLAANCQPGETVYLRGSISPVKNRFTKTGKFIQVAEFTDRSGSIPIIWFNQTYLSRSINQTKPVFLYGKVDFSFNHKPSLISPDIEFDPQDLSQSHTGYFPIYPETAGISSKFLRQKIKTLLPQIPENPIPPIDTPSWKQSITSLHFPQTLNLQAYRNRLETDELVVHILSGMVNKTRHFITQTAQPMQIDQKKLQQLISSLPFDLTDSQNSALNEILFDLTRPVPMNRLLEGDVGSGKTIVAILAAYICYLNGFQTLILAPTQILASQHFQTLKKILDPVNLKIGLLVSGRKTKSDSADFHIIVGTHALLHRPSFSKVGLVIIDEQHKFGVLQRYRISQAGDNPHVLTMTATPIPRSIALTMYGDLDLSYLKNRLQNQIVTWLVPEEKRPKSYLWLAEQIRLQQTQAFIVCPYIDISDSAASVKSAVSEFQRLQQVFSEFRLGLLHGRLTSAQKEQVMNDFSNHNLDILVCTPVVEVGIDIPNAGIIIIEDADRFGLAQLHQLRGRIGRKGQKSYCLLYSSKDTSRLEILTRTQSGLELAEADLKLRGPGQIFGTLQHGFIPFRVASFNHPELIIEAKNLAEKIFPDLAKYPFLKSLIERVKIDHVITN